MDATLIEALRQETPGCELVCHFNNAGTALAPRGVVDAVIEHLNLEQSLGGYEAAELASSRIENFYTSVARLLNCRAEEIAWVENSTRAWDMVFYAMNWQRGDRVITSQSEYGSNYLAMLQMQKRAGIEIDVIPNDAFGNIDLEELQSHIDNDVRLIALTHIPSQHGMLQPAQAVGRIAREADIPFLLDACQSVGQLEVDVQSLGCDMLTASGRKYLRGPRGTGFLYVRKDVISRLDPPFIDLRAAEWSDANEFRLHSDARRFENWECYVAGKIGLGVAIDYAVDLGLEKIQHRISELAEFLRSKLSELEGITVYEPLSEATGIITFSKANEDALSLQQRLRRHKINIGLVKSSTARLFFAQREAAAFNRISLHYYNNHDEIAKLLLFLQG